MKKQLEFTLIMEWELLSFISVFLILAFQSIALYKFFQATMVLVKQLKMNYPEWFEDNPELDLALQSIYNNWRSIICRFIWGLFLFSQSPDEKINKKLKTISKLTLIIFGFPYVFLVMFLIYLSFK